MLARRLFSSAPAFGACLRPEYGMFVGGAEITATAAGKTPSFFSVQNPATGEDLCRVVDGTSEDVSRAVRVAKEAYDSGVWSRADVRDRAHVMQAAAAALRSQVNEYAELECLQTGRAIREMRAQLQRLPEWLEYYAALIRTHEGALTPFKGPYVNYVKRVPLGVVAQITPWNHPMLISIKKIAPALAAGNSIVLKPSELAPITVLDFAGLCHRAGVPAGVLNVVPGMGATTGRALSEDPTVRMVDLTGGTPTGRVVAAAAGRNLAAVVMELGGKAPVMVFEDANLTEAVNGAAFASFIASGQTCIMGARLLVQRSVFDDVVSRFVDKVSRIQLGPPALTTTQMGPVISHAQRGKIESFVEGAKQEGARVLCGGRRAVAADFVGVDAALAARMADSGCFYLPTVLQVEPHMQAAREEIFGPVVVVHSFADEADAIRLANDSPYGLAAAVWTDNVKRAHRVADSLDVGIVWINDHHRNDPSSPWGGMKDSGLGRENGIEALHAYTQTRSVVVGMSDAPFDWFQTGSNVRYS